MKKVYELPEIKKTEFEMADIITASSSLIMGDHHAGGMSSKQMESTWNDELKM